MNLDRLRDIREDHDYRQEELAQVLKVSQAQYSRYELGVNIIPIEKLVLLARFYNTSVDFLVGLTDERTPYPRSFLKEK